MKARDGKWGLLELDHLRLGFERLASPVSLETMKGDDALSGMLVLQKGTRLSVTPVERAHFQRLLVMSKAVTRVPKAR